jgi:putative endonuclease
LVRVDKHNEGVDEFAYTFSRRPVVLRFYEEFRRAITAIKREKQLKGWSRKKKEALMQNNIPLLIKLSNWKKKGRKKDN